jgi:hypothetical protein
MLTRIGLCLGTWVPATALVACTASISTPGSEPDGAAAYGAGGTAAGAGGGPPDVKFAQGATVPAGMRRLTASQYRATVGSLFGSSVLLATELDADDANAPFAITGSYRITTGPNGVRKYEEAAAELAGKVLANPQLWRQTLGCEPAEGAACAASFVKSFGRRAWRRPLTDVEAQRYVKLITDASAALASPQEGFSLGLQALLQSPSFIYMPELGEAGPAGQRYTSHEMATRLAYLLTEAPPDAELSGAADRGELVTPAGVAQQVRRLMDLPQVRPVLAGFFGQLFNLRELDDITKSDSVFPEASPALMSAMREEFNAFIEHNAFVKRGALLDILDGQSQVTSPELAALYGDAPERGGVLTTGAWLSIQAKADRTSPTLRGVWVRERLLCQDVPPPPPNVSNGLLETPDPEQPQDNVPLTTRERLELHRSDPACGACHALFDPIGVAFEHFDGIGAYRTTENGELIDTSGELDGQAFADARELSALLKADPRVSDCLVQHLFEFVSGHDNLETAPNVVSDLGPGFRARPDYVELFSQMVTSNWFAIPAAPL